MFSSPEMKARFLAGQRASCHGLSPGISGVPDPLQVRVVQDGGGQSI